MSGNVAYYDDDTMKWAQFLLSAREQSVMKCPRFSTTSSLIVTEPLTSVHGTQESGLKYCDLGR